MKNLKDYLEKQSEEFAEKNFILFRGQKIKYQEINLLSNRFAHAFHSLGIRARDNVAVMLPNSPEWISCWFGLSKIGAVLVAFNTQWKAESITHALMQTDVKAILIGEEFLAEFLKAKKPAGLITILDSKNSSLNLTEGFIPLSTLLYQTSSENPTWEGPAGYDPLIITFTSGTTGFPKAVVNPHHAYIVAAEDLVDYVELTSADIIYTFLPLYHANPQVYCVLTALTCGGTIALAERFSASRFWTDIIFYQATAFSYVGGVLPILLHQPKKPEEKLSSAKKCFGGGAPLDIHEATTCRFGLQVCELYGMSETGTWNTINRPSEIKIGSVGKVRRGFDVRIFDEYDHELPAGKIGEIVIRPLQPFIMFLGYYKMPEETLSSYRNLWFHTGDLGMMDAEGFFYFCGRKKEIIRRGGENISPLEIERVLNNHPAVAETAAVGVPDPILGEEIKVYIVLKEGKTVKPEELIQISQEKLPPFMIPRYVEFISELPKTPSEKVQKLVLKNKGVGNAWDRLQHIKR